MTLLQTTRAQSLSQVNLTANLEALKHTQAHLQPHVTAHSFEQIEWVHGRDGTLTALLEDGAWWSGCSIPTRAARAMLGRLEIKGAVGCFLNPPHSAHLAVALRTMRTEQGLIVVLREWRDLALFLHGEDFSQAIASHRLWFVAGADWEEQLTRLFDEQPGLATPAQFVRTPDSDAAIVDQLLPAAQKIFAQVSSARAAEIQSLREKRSAMNPAKICVVAPSRFRLWNDVGQTMLDLFNGIGGIEVVHFDADDPSCSAPLALLKTAMQCGLLFTANTSRSDLPGLIPDTIPWITWVTTARVPSGALAGCDDHLILVDPMLRETALKSGWNPARIHVGGWPTPSVRLGDASPAGVCLISDTSSLQTPKDLTEYSSHALLWESMRNELLANPFSLTGIGRFLSQHMGRLNIGEQGFPQARFIEKLILPAYQQGIARAILAEKLPLRLRGEGWDQIDEFKACCDGPIRSREQLREVVAGSTVLLHAWPTNLPHPMDSAGAPVVRSWGKDRPALLRNIRGLLQGKTPARACNQPSISAQIMGSIAASVSARL